MNQYGKLVLWMGLILMALQIAAQWVNIRSIIFHGEPSGSSSNQPFNVNPPSIGPTWPGTGISLLANNLPNTGGNPSRKTKTVTTV